MKASDFSKLLDHAADFLEAAKGASAASALHQLASVFRGAPAKTVASIIAKLEPLDVGTASFLQTRLESLSNLMPSLTAFATSLAPKCANDLELVSGLLSKHARAPLDEWVQRAAEAASAPPAKKGKEKSGAAALNSELVERYNRLLETNLGDDAGFRSAYARLEADPEMRAPEVAALAKRFAAASTKARSAALKKIMARHQALIIGRAASAATAGRVAG